MSIREKLLLIDHKNKEAIIQAEDFAGKVLEEIQDPTIFSSSFQKVQELIITSLPDELKFSTKANQAAGTRIRNAMQEIKVITGAIMKVVQVIRKTDEIHGFTHKINKSAAVRLRHLLTDNKNLAQEIRVEIQDLKNA